MASACAGMGETMLSRVGRIAGLQANDDSKSVLRNWRWNERRLCVLDVSRKKRDAGFRCARREGKTNRAECTGDVEG